MIRTPLYRTLEPHPRLQGRVESVWVQEHPPAPAAPPTTVLPSGRVELIVSYGDPFARLGGESERVVPQLAITGQRTRPQRVRALGSTGLIIVVFYPWAAGALLGRGAAEAADRIFAVSERFGARAERGLREAVAPGRSLEERVRGVQNRVIELLEGGSIERLDIESVRRIHESHGAASVERLAWDLGFSRRHLLRRLTGSAGLAPKKLSSIVRFQRALALLQAGGAASAVAYDCGYADQAHLIRHLRAFGDVTPAKLLDRLNRPIARTFNGEPRARFHSTVYLQ